MDIGIGLPSAIPGVEGRRLLDWARQADARGFSSVGTLDRLVYDNYEPLIALTAAASVTERVRLTTAVLLAPLHRNAALFAKQAASLDRLSNGRLVLGLAVGGRPDDFEASGVDIHRRASDIDALLETARRIWAGESSASIGPRPARAGGPQLIIGGQTPASFQRAAKYGSGWIAGGGGAEAFKSASAALRQTWSAAGRTDKPRVLGLAYFGLGPAARASAERNLRHYYAFAGPYADMVVQSALIGEDAIRTAVADYAAAECDELILSPCDPDLGQVDALADVVLSR